MRQVSTSDRQSFTVCLPSRHLAVGFKRQAAMSQTNRLAVIIVTYCSGDVIGACLDSLLASDGPGLDIIVVDNASPDDTAACVNQRSAARGPHSLTLIHAPSNGGYAAGVNLGLAQASSAPFVWILNPDCVVLPQTPARLLSHANSTPAFSLMGGRTLYAAQPCRIQSDGGRIDRWTGVCRLVNRGCAQDTSAPDAASLDFISGAHMLASRAFLDRAGPLEEGFFLYYEEVDWAARRGNLPLAFCADAIVYHHAGTAIGSAAPGRPATAFSNYFNYRSRMRFLCRRRAWALPTAFAFALLKIGQMALSGDGAGAAGALLGILGLAPPAIVRTRLAWTASHAP